MHPVPLELPFCSVPFSLGCAHRWDLASQLLLVAFIYNLPFLYNFSCSQAIKLTLDAGLSSSVWVPVFQQRITGVMAWFNKSVQNSKERLKRGRKANCYKGKVFVCPRNCCLMSLPTPEIKYFVIKADLFVKVFCLKDLWSPAPLPEPHELFVSLDHQSKNHQCLSHSAHEESDDFWLILVAKLEKILYSFLC